VPGRPSRTRRWLRGVIALEVQRAADHEAGLRLRLGVGGADAIEHAARRGERFAAHAELIVGAGQRELGLDAALLQARGLLERRERRPGLARREQADAEVVARLPRGRIDLDGALERGSGVALATEAALQLAQGDERARLARTIARIAALRTARSRARSAKSTWPWST
jgi:hypothetical protein